MLNISEIVKNWKKTWDQKTLLCWVVILDVEDRRCWNMDLDIILVHKHLHQQKSKMASFLVRIKHRGGQLVTWVNNKALIGSAPS